MKFICYSKMDKGTCSLHFHWRAGLAHNTGLQNEMLQVPFREPHKFSGP